MGHRSDVQIIKPPNTLEKAKTGRGRVTPDVQAIKRAEVAITKIGEDFASWAQSDLDEMDQALGADREDPGRQDEFIMRIFRRAFVSG